jgi:hypothetical protein
LLLAIGSEVDVLCKIACEHIDSTAPRNNIDHYRACLSAHSQVAAEQVLIRRYGLSFTPWEAWTGSTNPAWWRSYNNVKHARHTCFAEANLENGGSRAVQRAGTGGATRGHRRPRCAQRSPSGGVCTDDNLDLSRVRRSAPSRARAARG